MLRTICAQSTVTAMHNPSVSVVAPVFNEGSTIEATIREWNQSLAQSGVSYEIVVCDDASTDQTTSILLSLSENLPLRVASHPMNRGAGAALRTAISVSRGERLILIDSDGQFQLSDGLEMLRSLPRVGDFFMIGVRLKKRDKKSMVLGSILTSKFANLIFGTNLRDFNCALKVVDARTMKSLGLRTTRFNYSTEATARLLMKGFKPLEVVVGHRSHPRNRSLFKQAAAGMERIRFLMFIRSEMRLIKRGIIDV
jgi:dolichol-phosphate mannosyltransferase